MRWAWQATAVFPHADTGDNYRRPTPVPGPLANRWLSLFALTTLAAIDGPGRRCRCAAPAAEARGFHPPPMRATVGGEIARRLHAATAHAHQAAERGRAA